MLSEAFSRLLDRKLLLLFPIAFDLFAFILGVSINGFYGHSKVSLKLSIEVGLPSIASLVDQTVNFMHGLHFDLGQGPFNINNQLVILFIIGLLITAFLQAGYIGLLKDGATKKEPLCMRHFLFYGKKYWLSYLVLELLWLLFFALAFVFLIIPLKVLGILLFAILIITLRILFIYWEFTIIVDDLSTMDALHKSRKYFTNRTEDLVPIIVAMLAINFAIGLILNAIWNEVFFLLTIFLYGFIATGIQLTLMLSLYEVKKENDESKE